MTPPPDKAFARVFRSPRLSFGTYRCTRDNRAAGPEQDVPLPVLNVTFAGVYVRHVGRREDVADASRVVFHERGQVFRTSHPIGGCDCGTYLQLDRALLAELNGAPGDLDAARWPVRSAPLPPRLLLEHRWLLRALAPGGPEPRGRPDDLECESRLLEHVGALIRAAGAAGGAGAACAPGAPGAAAAPALPRSHRDLARAAQLLLAAPGDAPRSLGELAAALDVSVFHLCRVFKRATGATLHGYREQVRLAAALDRVRRGEADFARLAAELGFASHSHFSARFRRAFGLTPREARART